MKKKLPSPRTLQNLWLKSLESGKYKQCEGALRDAKGDYCCLGVACRVLQKFTTIAESEDIYGRTQFAGTFAELRPRHLRMLGLRPSAQKLCMEMNDHDNLSFKQIAATIRKDRKKFFR